MRGLPSCRAPRATPPLPSSSSSAPCALPPRFKGFIDRLLWDREAQPEDVYRIKGNLNFVGSETKHFVQVRWCTASRRGLRGG